MKKMINTAFTYALLAMAGGVFYREFTKFNHFTGQTNLGFVHTHLFVLGMIGFLIVALFVKNLPDVITDRKFKAFYILYNTGLCITAVTLAWRGIIQVLSIPVSGALSASISGIAGIGHILLGVGIVLFFIILRKKAD
ncbi:DUF2871 domain-containing protein [Eubacterium sp. 1001713B170207_170306_E7]|uniref:DUF2871 domain-containing protein n=1 Tax=Eubacterium sp. 1001713B170207_170306_E7 TaxID=2787097 RepID=UPI00189B6D41|nr:DUF2871 domain-containing protein [Eubacterium sp. 1001713B170207_170306_E7]